MKEADKFNERVETSPVPRWAPELNKLLDKAKKYDQWANRALSFEMIGCASVSGISAAEKHWDVTLLGIAFFYISKSIHFDLDRINIHRMRYIENLKSVLEKEEANYGTRNR